MRCSLEGQVWKGWLRRRVPATVVELRGPANPGGGRVCGDGVGRRRQLGWPTGVPFSGGTCMEGSAVNLESGGAVEDVCWGGAANDVVQHGRYIVWSVVMSFVPSSSRMGGRLRPRSHRRA
jgi:hypothetical protein